MADLFLGEPWCWDVGVADGDVPRRVTITAGNEVGVSIKVGTIYPRGIITFLEKKHRHRIHHDAHWLRSRP